MVEVFGNPPLLHIKYFEVVIPLFFLSVDFLISKPDLNAYPLYHLIASFISLKIEPKVGIQPGSTTGIQNKEPSAPMNSLQDPYSAATLSL